MPAVQLRCVVGALWLSLLASSGQAQAPAGSRQLTASDIRDSVVSMARLDSAIQASPRNAAAWHRRGMIAWSLADRATVPPVVADLDVISLRRLADTSLRIAVSLDTASAGYRLAVGKFLLAGGVSTSRPAAYAAFEAALALARRRGSDSLTHSEAAVEVGRTYWRRYDAMADRWMQTAPGEACSPYTGLVTPGGDHASGEGVSVFRDMLNQCAQPMGEFPGEADYLRAEEYFREAYHWAPWNPRAFRQLAMLLAERNRWTELRIHARSRLAFARGDAWAHFADALAHHRLESGIGATYGAFSAAFTFSPDAERLRFNHLERIYNPRDSAKVGALADAARFATNRLYWLAATPLWSQPFDFPQMEFLSRVTYAELRWTVDELNVRGADTDRGDVHIRYGVPGLIAGFGSSAQRSETFTKWAYASGLVFTFVGQPTFGTARIPPADEAVFAEIVTTAPVRWRVPRNEFVVDSMEVQVARFRGPDSLVDVMIATEPPHVTVNQRAEVSMLMREDLWLLKGGTIVIKHDSVIPRRPGPLEHRYRVAPWSYMFRAEYSALNANRAARVSAALGAAPDAATGFPTNGFGISDILVATLVGVPNTIPRRWSDLTFVPLVGAARTGSRLTLVWENYEFGRRDGGADYAITITLARVEKSQNRLGLRVLYSAARAMGVTRTEDRVVMEFDRTMPHAATILDRITLELSDTPPGSYEMVVRVVDRISGATATRTFPLSVTR